MKKSRILCMILAFVLVAALAAGCSKTSDKSDDTGSKSASTGDNNNDKGKDDASSKEDELEPITFTMFCADPNSNYENFESPVAQVIKEKTGVTLEMEYPVGDLKQKISLMAASGDYPDFIYAKGDANILVDAGAFIDLTDLIEEHGPNLKILYGDYLKRLRWSLEDQSIYFLGSYGVNEVKWEPSAGFQLQHAVVRELGFPELRTVKDFENAIRQYIQKYPTIDGQPTIGLSQLADDWRIQITVTNPASFATGQYGDDGEWYIDQETHKAVFHHTRPIEKEYHRWLNHMYNTGLLDPESYTQKYDQYKAKIASGRVLALTDAEWQYSEPMTKLRQDGKEERMYGMYPLTLNEDITYMDGNFYTGGYSGGWGVGISVNCKDPERAIKFMDWMATDEAQILNHWGIEGVHYKVVDGKRVIPPEEWEKRRTDPEYGKKTGVGVYTYPFPQQGRGAKDPTGQYYDPNTPEQEIENYTEIEKEVLAAYNAKMWQDLYPKGFPAKKYGVAWQINIPQDTEAAVIWQKCLDITWKRIPEAIMAKPDKFDEIWDEYQKELEEAGVHEMEETFNKLLADRIKLWND